MWAQSGDHDLLAVRQVAPSSSCADRRRRRAVVRAAAGSSVGRVHVAQVLPQVEHAVLAAGGEVPQHVRAGRRPGRLRSAPRRAVPSDRRRGTASGRRGAASPARASRPSPRAPRTLSTWARSASGSKTASSCSTFAQRAGLGDRPHQDVGGRAPVAGHVALSHEASRTTTRSRPRPRGRERAISASTSSAICGTVHRCRVARRRSGRSPRWSGASTR